MLPDLSGTHVFIVLIAALIFIGPKDLPVFLRKIGKFVGKMRGMANEFRASFDEMARQSELDDLRKEVEAMRQASHAAIPQDLGISAQMQSDAEAAYLANWEASHAPSADGALAAEAAVPPAETPVMAGPKPVKAAAKPKAAPKTAAASKPAPKKAAKTAVVAEAAPKPRARKAKPGTDA